MCFIINKLLAPGNWAYKLDNVFVAVVTLRLEGGSVIVINMYNPIGNKKVIIIGRIMELALDEIKREIILLKNSNAHYFMWGSRATVIKHS